LVIKYLKIDPKRAWVLDIECNGLDPTEVFVVVVQNLETGETKEFYDTKSFMEFNIHGPWVFIGHNILNFDIPSLNRLWATSLSLGDCIDTLVLSYLYRPALEGGHSLDAWGRRLGLPKTEFFDWSCLSPEMVRYCKNDVELTVRLYKALSQRMLDYGFSELSCKIEHQIRVVIDEQQRNGFYFDRAKADTFRTKLRAEQARIEEDIHKLFPPKRVLDREVPIRLRKDNTWYNSCTRALNENDSEIDWENNVVKIYTQETFNLGSPKQRVERLLELGWKPEKFTEKGFPKVDEDALVAFSKESGRPEVHALAEWLVIQGRASMLDTWFNNLGADSRIHGRVFTCGASTRRMTHNSPNTANIPSGAKAKYGDECRSFWGVEPNKGLVLVGYDASGLENAGMLHYLNNPKATETLNKKKPDDVHSRNARFLAELLKLDVSTPELFSGIREWQAKTGFYAMIYGCGDPKLASIIRSTEKNAKEFRHFVINGIPGFADLLEDVGREFKRNDGRLKTIDGGLVWCPSFSAALNYRIQSAGTITMKLAAILLDKEAKKERIPFLKVGDIHDEGQLETHKEYGDALGSLAVKCIARAGESLGWNLPLGGSYKIGQNWSETH
jgi:DNA polymerase I-like protein with 3'-5' exonuclease and polymerase domains